MRTPITRPRNGPLALRIRITAIAIIDMLCEMPASIRQAIAADKVLIWANTKSIAYQIAVSDAVADHPEQRSDQGSPVIERGQHGEQQHRSGLDHHIPAEDKRLHLERPGGEQIGRPLKAIIADAKGSERGFPRNPAQGATTSVMRSTLPCFFPVSFALGLCVPIALKRSAAGCAVNPTRAWSADERPIPSGLSRHAYPVRPIQSHGGRRRGSENAIFRSAGNGRNWS